MLTLCWKVIPPADLGAHFNPLLPACGELVTSPLPGGEIKTELVEVVNRGGYISPLGRRKYS